MVDQYYTIGTLTQSIIEGIGDVSSKVSVNSWLSAQRVYEVSLKHRAALVREKMMLRSPISKQSEQTMVGLKLRKADLNLNDLETPAGCMFLVSVDVLPTVLKWVSLTSNTGMRKFDYIEWDNLKSVLSSRHEAKKYQDYFGYLNMDGGVRLFVYAANPYSIQENTTVGGLEIYDHSTLELGVRNKLGKAVRFNSLLRSTSLTAIFYDPLEVQKINWKTGELAYPCKLFEDYAYVHDPDVIGEIANRTRVELLGDKQGIRQDDLQDAEDTSLVQKSRER